VGVRTVAVRVAIVALAVGAAVWAASGYRAVYVGGGSMAPALWKGDLVVVRRGAEGVGQGDVVLVAKQGWPSGVLHRVLAVNADDTLVLRGDSNPVADRDPVRPGSVMGVVACVVPTGRILAVAESVRR
jgi:signal peptidase I